MKQPDSIDVGTQMDVVRHRLNVAREDLETAHLTFEAERGANNRAYYSIFHTICAVLAKEGVAFKRHKDTLSYFNKNYVQPEIFPRELGRKIVKAEEIRHARKLKRQKKSWNWQRNIYLQNQRAHLKMKILINQSSNNSQSKPSRLLSSFL